MADVKAQKNRFFRLWRRNPQGGAAARSVSEEGALWAAHTRATEATQQAAEAAQLAASSTVKQRASLDAGADEARATGARGDEAQRQLARVADAFERLNILALNAGLEGARLGEVAGRPLSLVSDEVRSQAERGSESARELVRALQETMRELSALATRFDDARALGADITQHASGAAGAAAESARALGELGDRLRKATGSDPETAQAIAQATEHARALVGALGTLSGRVPRNLLTAALRPMLEPLVRALFDEEELAEEEEKAT